MGPSTIAVKGLATVALLKVYFDAGHDHIGMFMPFVLDVIRSQQTDDFGIADIKTGLSSRHGLEVPTPALQTLMSRATKRGSVRREGGRYFRNPSVLNGPEIISQKATVEREHAAVAKKFREFASSMGVQLVSEDGALGLLLAFLEERHIAMLVEPDPAAGLAAPELLSRREALAVARFLQEIFRSDPQLSEYIIRMLEGLVLRNALLLKDISFVTRKFSDLSVVFDTGFLLQALGFEGDTARLAARETLDLLKATKAALGVFERTLDEIKRILSVYQHHLKSREGILTLRPTEVTRHLLARCYTPSDVMQATALLERNMRQLGIRILPYPSHEPCYTLDEGDLSRRLQGADETELEPRVMHDVDTVAAILTLRAGHVAVYIEDARAVFVTTSYSVVRTVVDWYRSQTGSGVPPFIHSMALSNLAWLKKPNIASRLKQHELVASCSAALRPSEAIWTKFVRRLRELLSSGELASDDCVAAVVQSLAEPSLIELDDEAGIDAETMSDVIDRVKASYQKDAAREVAAADLRVKEHEARMTAAEAAAKTHEEKRRQLEIRVYARAEAFARWCSAGIFWVLGVIIVVGLGLTLPGFFPKSPWWAQAAAWVAVTITFFVSVGNLLWGTHVNDWQHTLETRIASSLKTWLTTSGEDR